MINARAESVADKPAYRTALRRPRCLIPAEGFYEWRALADGKQPQLIWRKDQTPFVKAGLWDAWQDASGNRNESCSIIVTDSNAATQPIRDRMPVIPGPANHGAWLDPLNQDWQGLSAMLKPADPRDWKPHPVPGRSSIHATTTRSSS